jgi:hypothetical protein
MSSALHAPPTEYQWSAEFDHVRLADGWGTLLGVRNRGLNLAYWPRQPANALAAWLAGLHDDDLPGIDTDGSLGDVGTAVRQTLAARFPTQSGALMLAEDIADLIDGWALVTEATRCHLLLERIDSDQCMKFHTDQVGIRLLCTYRGPGTWWVPNHLARRDLLGTDADNQDIVPDVDDIREVPTSAIALLKGDAYDPLDVGIIHRSPPIASRGLVRLLLRIDDVTNCGCGIC